MDPAGNATVCHGLIEDLDITGVGVRSTFYVTSSLAVVNACIPGCDVRGSFWAMVFTSLALFIAAVIQAFNKTISLYNTLIVVHLCCLHVFSSFAVLKVLRWVHRKGVDSTLTAVATGQWVVWNLFAFLLRSGIPDFGSQPECNLEKNMIFWGRERAPFFWYTFSLSLLLLPVPEYASLRRMVEHFASTRKCLRFLVRHEWKFGLPFFIFGWISVVVTIEETISHNPVIHDGPRFVASFGQIFPIVTIGIPVMSIYYDAKAWFRGRVRRGSLPETVQDLPNTSRNSNAFLATPYGSFGANASAIPLLPPLDTEMNTRTTTPFGDEVEKTLDDTFRQSSGVDVQAPSETVAREYTYPPPQLTRSMAAVEDGVLQRSEFLKNA